MFLSYRWSTLRCMERRRQLNQQYGLAIFLPHTGYYLPLVPAHIGKGESAACINISLCVCVHGGLNHQAPALNIFSALLHFTGEFQIENQPGISPPADFSQHILIFLCYRKIFSFYYLEKQISMKRTPHRRTTVPGRRQKDTFHSDLF